MIYQITHLYDLLKNSVAIVLYNIYYVPAIEHIEQEDRNAPHLPHEFFCIKGSTG